MELRIIAFMKKGDNSKTGTYRGTPLQAFLVVPHFTFLTMSNSYGQSINMDTFLQLQSSINALCCNLVSMPHGDRL